MKARAQSTVADREQKPDEPKRAINQCEAHGCPIPATINDGGHVCCLHYGANRDGWPHATRVAIELELLWEHARQAQALPSAEACSADLARRLFDAAKADGLHFTDAQRAEYRHRESQGREWLRVKFAGQLVEAAIRAKAHQAAGAVVRQDRDDGRPAVSKLALALAGFATCDTGSQQQVAM